MARRCVKERGGEWLFFRLDAIDDVFIKQPQFLESFLVRKDLFYFQLEVFLILPQSKKAKREKRTHEGNNLEKI